MTRQQARGPPRAGARDSPHRRQKPLSGDLVTFGDGLVAFSGDLVTFSGDLVTFGGGLVAFSGGLVAFSGDLVTFGGGLVAFSGDLVTFSGDLVLFRGLGPRNRPLASHEVHET